MEIILAEEYGFCFGVERAINMVEKALEEGNTVRTLGPLIHNQEEIKRLEDKGVRTIGSPFDIKDGETAVIRAHGVPPDVEAQLKERASKVVDATCPFVTRVQRLAARAAAQDRHVVVVGNPEHPEMIGVKGYAPNHAFIVRDVSEIENLPKLKKPLVVSQTTIKSQTFYEVAEAVKTKTDDEVEVVNTICSATRDRQDAARELAEKVEVVYVIGARHSSNSQKLLVVSKEKCEKSFLIEKEDEINPEDLKGVKKVGVTASASTPNWLIEKVIRRLEEIGKTLED
ncbi:MAG: 4-hydroxy-3-methylbut-2-enyl diphosphate reductase [Pyrinomonadaceae bacterium]|nr:4-hydroxy-3-methylbut-2-enyl diphosphate reductase [Pyrinomonadaceae bacterium]MCX7639451.1 4-hydroxy-3-methylbut-2-enyl diphosphate reductase [Pyrinomonadaceae bacterium]MDW8304499.1 4-hydroxy-3-methylbut-2-enyl diphosphate reductase [Acidobacteriota bacterium]